MKMISRLALGLAVVSGLAAAEADPRPLQPDEVARAEEALRQLTAAEQPVVVPDHLEVLLTVIRRQLDDCEAYLQVEMGARAGESFLAAQRSLKALDEEYDEQMRAVVIERVTQMRRRLDRLARRLLQDEGLVPLDPDRIEAPPQSADPDPGEEPEGVLLDVADDAPGDVLPDAAVPVDPDVDPDQDRPGESAAEDEAEDSAPEPVVPETDDQEH